MATRDVEPARLTRDRGNSLVRPAYRLAEPRGDRRERAGAAVTAAPLDRIRAWGEVAAGAPAAADAEGTIGFSALRKRIDVLADVLSEAGVRAGDRVALETARHRDVVTTILALWKLGAAYVPVDPGWPAARLEDILEDAGAETAVVCSGDGRPFEARDLALVDAARAKIVTKPRRRRDDRRATADGLAYILYTSGS